jgi:hypothetical protein
MESRLTQLRALVHLLERLPASSRREWMLQEARSRMVDVDTGDDPRPMRRRSEEPPPAAPPPAPRAVNGRAAKRQSPKPTPAGMPLDRTPPDVSTQRAPAPHPIAEADMSPATFGTDDLLSLEDLSGDPGDSSAPIAPWRRGLRG